MKKSLQVIKNDMIKKEETLKALHKLHPHLTHLSKIQILTYLNVNTISEFEPYLNESIKLYDDVSIKDTQLCTCTDSKGQPKDLYASEEFAQKEVTILTRQTNLKLKIYLCPSHCGWHLSKR